MKVLIVDDELGIIDMLKNTTPWASLGIQQLLTAGDGKAGLALAEQQKPDIVIADIEMPVMDGITMAEQIAERIPEPPEIIFLTCHAEFHYTQRAIRCGVSDYLLKPFFPEELTAVLSKAVVRCREKQHLGDQEIDKRGYMLQSFLRDILNHVYEEDTERIRWASKRHGVFLDPDQKWYLVAVGIPIEEARKHYQKSELMFMYGNVCREMLYGLDAGKSSILVDYTLHQYYTAYLFLDEEHRTGLEEKCSRLTAALQQYLEVTAVCVISDGVTVSGFAETRDRIDGLLNRTMGDSPAVLLLETVEKKDTSPEIGINHQQILGFLRERKKTELFLYMRHFLEQPISEQNMRQIALELHQLFLGYLYENRIDTAGFMQDEMSRQITGTAAYSSMDMMKYVSFSYDSMVNYIETLKRSDSVIERAKQFIERHYMENIGRTEIAQEVLLAPNYLSMLFHKETGQTIREYICLCRVKEAKKLMAITNNSITDVAMQVGFDNISYFSTVFKKYTGITPVEYRHNLQQEAGEKKV